MADLADRVRTRIRDEMQRKHLSQRDVSGILGGAANGWSQSRIAKLLSGQRELGVDDMQDLCFAVELSVVEVVRDHGLEFLAEMTPTEMRILERFRQYPPIARDALLTIMQVTAHTKLQERRALPPKKAVRKLS